jgi:regulator of sirC expression with transglutaminase-like and TPR domain
MLYLIIAQQLHLPIYGVRLQQFFVVCYCKEMIVDFDAISPNQVLFYMNPFNRGEIFNKSDIDVYLKRLDASPSKHNYTPCSHRQSLYECIELMIASYEKEGKQDEVNELNQLKEILY